MVKIVERSFKELAEKERESKLENIAKMFLGEKFEVDTTPLGNIALSPKKIDEPHIAIVVYLIYPPDNKIRVNNRDYLEEAIKLAEAYESSGEPEFTIKKDYDE